MNEQAPVLVGLGDAGQGIPELDWAAQDALTRGRPVRVVRTFHLSEGTVPWASSIDRTITEDLRHAAERRLDQALRHVASTWPDLEASGDLIDGVPSRVLVDESAHADVTVLGSRRLSPMGAALLGSVSTVVAAEASGPVVVVGRPGGLPDESPAVVVGVDGRDRTDEVLLFAFDHASRYRRPLRPLFCWSPDALATAKWRGSPPPPDRADRWLAEVLAGWQEKYPDVVVHRGVVRDHPVAGLVAASAGQDLLVVGSHSRHARIPALLGSVSQGVLHHAACPVAVVHPRAHV